MEAATIRQKVWRREMTTSSWPKYQFKEEVIPLIEGSAVRHWRSSDPATRSFPASGAPTAIRLHCADCHLCYRFHAEVHAMTPPQCPYSAGSDPAAGRVGLFPVKAGQKAPHCCPMACQGEL